MPSWDDFEKPKRPEPAADEFALLCAGVLGTVAGQRLLQMLRDMTIEKQISPSAPDRALVAIEAQRQFVRRMETATQSGLAQAKTNK